MLKKIHRRHLKVLKQIHGYLLILIAVFILFLGGIFGFLVYKKDLTLNLLESNIRRVIDHKSLAYKITLGSFTSTNLLSNISIQNISIYNNNNILITKIPYAKIIYNPLKLFIYGEFIPIIEKIILDKATFNILENNKQEWSLSSKSNKKDGFINIKPKSYPKIVIKNTTLNFKKSVSIKRSLLSSPVHYQLSNLNGSLNFEEKPYRYIGDLIANISENSQIKLSPTIHPDTNQFYIKFNINSLPIDPLNEFLFENKYLTKDTHGQIYGYIWSSPSLLKSTPIFWDINLKIKKNTYFKTPFLRPTFNNISQGIISCSIGKITKKLLNQIYNNEDIALKIYNDFKKNNYINEHGHISQSIKKILLNSYISPDSNILSNPQIFLEFDKVHSKLKDIPSVIDGHINITKKTIAVDIKTETTSINHFKIFLPKFLPAHLSGKAQVSSKIYGNFNNLVHEGYITSPKLKIDTIHVNRFRIYYRHNKKMFLYDLRQGYINNAPISLSGHINLDSQSKNKSFNNSLFISNLNTRNIPYFNKAFPHTNHIDIYISLNGTYPKISSYNSVTFKNNDADYSLIIPGNINFLSKKNLSFNALIKSSFSKKMVLSGEWNNKNFSLNFKVDGSKFKVPRYLKNHSYNLFKHDKSKHTIDFLLSITMDLRKNLKKDMLSAIQSNLDISYKTKKHLLSASIKNNKKVLLFNNILIELTPTENIQVKNFIIQNQRIHSGSITFNNYPLSHLFSFSNKSLPSILESNKMNAFFNFHPTKSNDIAQTSFSIKNILLSKQIIPKIEGNFKIKKDKSVKLSTKIQTNKSLLLLSGSISPKQKLSIAIDPKSSLYLPELKLSNKFQFNNGLVSLKGDISGLLNTPTLKLHATIKNAKINNVLITKGQSNLKLSLPHIAISNTKLQSSHGELSINFNGEVKDKKIASYLSELSIKNGNLNKILKLIPKSKNSKKINAIQLSSFDKIEDPYLKQNKNSVTLYSNSSKKSSSEFYKKISLDLQDRLKTNLQTSVNGIIHGKIKLTKQAQKSIPNIRGSLTFENLAMDPLYINHGELKAISINEKSINYDVFLENIRIKNAFFKEISSIGNINHNYLLSIYHLDILDTNQSQYENILSGVIPLKNFMNPQKKQAIDITLTLNKDNITLLSLISPNIDFISNKGKIQLNYHGSLKKPILSAKHLDLDQFKIMFKKPYNSSLTIPNSKNITLKNNRLHIPQCTFISSFQEKINTHQVQGEIEITRLSLQPFFFQINHSLSLSPGKLSFNTPWYVGEANLYQASVKGSFSHPSHKNTSMFSIAGDLYNGTITPTLSKKKPLPSYIHSNISLGFNENVSIETKLTTNSTVSGLYIQVLLDKSKLFISGPLNNLSFENTINIQSGHISLMGQQFDIIPLETQSIYLSSTNLSSQKNVISFPDKKQPFLNLRATTVIPYAELNSNKPTYKHIMIAINDSYTNLKNVRIYTYSSQGFSSKSSSLQYEESITLSEETPEKLLQLFLPKNKDVSESLLSRYGTHHLNTLLKQQLLRPIEKNLAESIGLSDLRIDYNFNPDLIENPNNIAVNIAKSLLSNKLIFRAKTTLALEQSATPVNLSEIELSYHLSPNLSINYSTFQQQNTSYLSKVSLRLSHEF